MMNEDCTIAFRRYREIARATWNLAFAPDAERAVWDCAIAYREAMARLFEALVLIPLGYPVRNKLDYSLGDAVPFAVMVESEHVEVMFDRNLPQEAAHSWAPPIAIGGTGYLFRFVNFFDWDELSHRDFQYVKVLVERYDTKPDVVGHHALIEALKCRVSVKDDEAVGRNR